MELPDYSGFYEINRRKIAMSTAPEPVLEAYLTLLELAIANLRMRIRYGEEVSLKEMHDYLDALHNIPIMLRSYGGWHVEDNIDSDLAKYDELWVERPDSRLRGSLVETLDRAKRGEFDTSDHEN